MFDYEQQHPHHPYDLWMHCLHTLIALPRDISDDMLYLAALIHDIGKSACRQGNFSPDCPGGMYHGHAAKSAEIIRAQERLIYYVEHHDDHIRMNADMIIAAGKSMDPALYCNLLYLEIGDSIAHAPVPLMLQRIAACKEAISFYSKSTSSQGS